MYLIIIAIVIIASCAAVEWCVVRWRHWRCQRTARLLTTSAKTSFTRHLTPSRIDCRRSALHLIIMTDCDIRCSIRKPLGTTLCDCLQPCLHVCSFQTGSMFVTFLVPCIDNLTCILCKP